MKKKIILGLAIVLFIFFGAVNSSFAVVDEFDIYMTEAYGDYDEETTFGWSQIPWLYVHVPEEDLQITAGWWESPGNEYFFAAAGPSTEQDVWMSLNEGRDSSGDDVTWADVREVGIWNVNAAVYYADGGIEDGYTDFTVTPEPVSSVLFMLGSISLAAAGYRRRKIAV